MLTCHMLQTNTLSRHNEEDNTLCSCLLTLQKQWHHSKLSVIHWISFFLAILRIVEMHEWRKYTSWFALLRVEDTLNFDLNHFLSIFLESSKIYAAYLPLNTIISMYFFFLNKTGVHRKYTDMTLKILFSLGGLFLQIHFNWIILISILTLLLCPLYERYAKRVAWFRFWAKGSVNVSLWIDNWYMECLET